MRCITFVLAFACLAPIGCGHHHHWVREGATHDESHRELDACEATVGPSATAIEACMREKGFEVD